MIAAVPRGWVSCCRRTPTTQAWVVTPPAGLSTTQQDITVQLLWNDPSNRDRDVPGRGVTVARVRCIPPNPHPNPNPNPNPNRKARRICPSSVQTFVELNGLRRVVRAHEMRQEGYQIEEGHDGRVHTVFSASDYVQGRKTPNRGARSVMQQ